MPQPQRPRRLARLAVPAVLASAAAACVGPLPPAYATPSAARASAGDLYAALAERFTNAERDPRFETARQKISRAALSPSGVYGDASVWTTVAPDGPRTLVVEAGAADGRYRFTPRADAAVPARLGDGRHVIRLLRAADGSYQWNTNVEQNLGRFRSGDAAAALGAALARLEQPAPAVRAELEGTFPRAGRALGRLFSLDGVETVPAGDGTTRVELTFGVRPDRLRAAGDRAFAGYVDSYVNGTRWTMTLEDGRGGRWGELAGGGGTLRVRLRLRDGELQSLDGPARALPDNLLLRTDLYTKVLLFEVGAERLVGDVAFVRTSRERGWSVRWRRAPRWHIPLGMRHLITGALDRPFAGEGMYSGVVLRDPGAPGTAGAGGGTLLVRQFDVAVQESALVRWLGGIGARAMNDLDGPAEVQQDRFLADALRALHADVEAAYAR